MREHNLIRDVPVLAALFPLLFLVDVPDDHGQVLDEALEIHVAIVVHGLGAKPVLSQHLYSERSLQNPLLELNRRDSRSEGRRGSVCGMRARMRAGASVYVCHAYVGAWASSRARRGCVRDRPSTKRHTRTRRFGRSTHLVVLQHLVEIRPREVACHSPKPLVGPGKVVHRLLAMGLHTRHAPR